MNEKGWFYEPNFFLTVVNMVEEVKVRRRKNLVTISKILYTLSQIRPVEEMVVVELVLSNKFFHGYCTNHRVCTVPVFVWVLLDP